MTAPQGPNSSPGQPSATDPAGVKGMAADPSTLASTGLLAAVIFAIVAGLINALSNSGSALVATTTRDRLLALTITVDVGDVALLGVAVALLLLTPDPPGGISRIILIKVAAALAGIISFFGVVRALVYMTSEGPFLSNFAAFVATLGVALAAATVAFYAAKESNLHAQGRI